MNLFSQIAVGCILLSQVLVFGETTNQYLAFVRAQAASLRAEDRPVATVSDWENTKRDLRRSLLDAWGDFPAEKVPLEARKLGELKREGYVVEKILFQTFPGVWMTANAYVPTTSDRPEKVPGLLMVHGHWRGAKQDPVVQARCIGAVKLGFFVLVVDAFGAGERGVGTALGEYHGEMTAATLFPVGRPLSGLQVYENMRAVDYLRTRPEVDPERIGITGASGGGNQTMYAGAWDERLMAAVPVCSVGNYQAYLGAACCMCEVVPGALRFTEEGSILGMVAPRALMVLNATRDAHQFSVNEAKKSIQSAAAIFQAYGKSENLRHEIFDSGHDYSAPMRETVYGWMSHYLKGTESSRPVSEPAVTPEDPEVLRCFPGESRPKDWVTIPRFAAAEGRRMVDLQRAKREKVKTADAWRGEAKNLRADLVRVLGGFPKKENLELKTVENGEIRDISYSPEPGIVLKAKLRGTARNHRVALILDLEGEEKAASSEAAREARKAGWNLLTVNLRATGDLAWPSDRIGRAPDHTSAEWGLWIGRPLLGQWTWDVLRLLEALNEIEPTAREIAVIGNGPAGMVALTVAALNEQVTRVATVGSLSSYISDVPYESQRLGIMVPGILKRMGDIADITALVAPRPVWVCRSVRGNGSRLTLADTEKEYAPAKKIYELLGAPSNLHFCADGVKEDFALFFSEDAGR